MKRNKLLIGLLLIISLFISIIPTNATYTLYTRISHIDENYLVNICEGFCSGGLNATSFTFSIQIEIWNPTNSGVEITTTNFDLFDPGFDAQFENESYYYQLSNIELPSINQHIIPSGLSQYNYTISFIVCSGNMVTLPYGNYTFWGEITSDHEIGFYETYLQVNSTGEFYSTEGLPDNWGSIIPTTTTDTIDNTMISIISTLFLLLYLRKLSNQKKRR